MADIKNTKNLCTVATDVVSDNTNFIVEDNKELKRVPKDQVIINSLTQLMANDTSNLLTGSAVSAQEILDVIADKVANKLLAKNQIINNLLATEVGNVLDATQGKVLMDKISQLNSDLEVEVNDLTDLLNPDYYDLNTEKYLKIYRVGNVKVLSIAIKAKALTGHDIIATNIPWKLRPAALALPVIQGRTVGAWASATYVPVVLTITANSITMSTGANASKLTYICGTVAYI